MRLTWAYVLLRFRACGVLGFGFRGASCLLGCSVSRFLPSEFVRFCAGLDIKVSRTLQEADSAAHAFRYPKPQTLKPKLKP